MKSLIAFLLLAASAFAQTSPYAYAYQFRTVNSAVNGTDNWYVGNVQAPTNALFMHSASGFATMALLGDGIAYDGSGVYVDVSTIPGFVDAVKASLGLGANEALRTDGSGTIVATTPAAFLTWIGGYPLSGNPSNFLTSVPAQSFSSLTGKPTTLSGYGITDAYPLSGNPSGFLTSVPAQSFSSLTGKPTTLSGYGITDAYPLSGNPSSFITTAGARTAVSLTTTGSGAATYNNSTGVLNIPTPTTPNYSVSTPTFSGSTTAAQLSTTQWANVQYSYDATVTISLIAGQSVTATLKYADNSGMSTNVVTVDALTTSNSGVLGLTQTNTLKVSGYIPPGKYRQVTFTISGSGAAAPTTIKAGQETLL